MIICDIAQHSIYIDSVFCSTDGVVLKSSTKRVVIGMYKSNPKANMLTSGVRIKRVLNLECGQLFCILIPL